jgi:dTDP-4-amino-4,6-dideoxygalactose transaminase
VLADIDPDTHNIDPEEVRRRISPRTKAIVPVHFAGRPCNMGALVALAEEHNLIIIEDCAHAIETDYRGKKAGTFGKCGVLSFYANKNVTTGEGGMVLTNDGDIASRIRKLSMHGILQHAWSRFSKASYKHYEVTDFGFKYNMTDMQAAIGIHQMQRIEPSWKRRKEIWEQYQEAFADLPLDLPAPIAKGARHAFHLYTIQIDPEKCGMHRDDFVTALHHQQIGTGVHYRPIPAHGIYRERFRWRLEDYPVAEKIGNTTVSLPLSPKLTPADVNSVIDAVRRTVISRRKTVSRVREVLNS